MTFSTGLSKECCLAPALCVSFSLCACINLNSVAAADPTTQALRSKVQTIVVIYAENRAFDNLYGNFPGAHGWSDAAGDGRQPGYVAQKDRDGTVLPALPQTWGGVTAAGSMP